MVLALVTLSQAGELPEPTGATLYPPTPSLEKPFKAQVGPPLAQSAPLPGGHGAFGS